MPLSNRLLRKYRKSVFVETGTYTGDTAIRAAKMGMVVHTIESHLTRYLDNRRKFDVARQHGARIWAYHGDSAAHLPHILAELEEPALIWLDAHGSAPLSIQNCPVMLELEAIRASKVAHTVLVDDLHHFDKDSQWALTTMGIRMGKTTWHRSGFRLWDIMAVEI